MNDRGHPASMATPMRYRNSTTTTVSAIRQSLYMGTFSYVLASPEALCSGDNASADASQSRKEAKVSRLTQRSGVSDVKLRRDSRLVFHDELPGPEVLRAVASALGFSQRLAKNRDGVVNRK